MLLMDEYFTCPICGIAVQLVAKTTHFDSEDKPPSFWRKGHRTGICEQLDQSGERIMIHFAVEYEQVPYSYYKNGKRYNHPGGRLIGHNKWVKL